MHGTPLTKAAARLALSAAVLALAAMVLAACAAEKPPKVEPKPPPTAKIKAPPKPVEKPETIKKPETPPSPPTWERILGGGKNDQASMALPVAGGGFVMVGSTFSQGAGGGDGWIVRMDRLGEVVWERTYGGKGKDGLTTVSPAPGGGFLVAGGTTTNSRGRLDGWVLRLDAQGNKLWEKTFGGAHNDVFNSSTPMPGGGTLMTGYTRSSGGGNRDAWFVWVSDDGKQSWERTEGGGKREEMSSIAAVPGGGFIAAGITRSFGAGKADAWVHRLGPDGRKTLWTRTFGDAAWNAIQSVAPVPGGGFILAGNTRSKTAGKADVWVVRLDARGQKVWERTIGGARLDYAVSAHPLENGGFLIGAVTRSKGAGGFDAWLIGLDGQGRQLWERTFGKSGDDGFSKVYPAPDGGFIAVGFTAKPGNRKDFDGWLLLLDQDGKVRR